jgi:hypothetical protein
MALAFRCRGEGRQLVAHARAGAVSLEHTANAALARRTGRRERISASPAWRSVDNGVVGHTSKTF